MYCFERNRGSAPARPTLKTTSPKAANTKHTRIVIEALVLGVFVGEEDNTDYDLVLDTNPQVPGIADAVVRNSNRE